MKKTLFIIIAVIIWAGNANAQSARDVLDRTAATIARARNGASASFRISGQSYGNALGQITIKGNRFYATSPGVKRVERRQDAVDVHKLNQRGYGDEAKRRSTDVGESV